MLASEKIGSFISSPSATNGRPTNSSNFFIIFSGPVIDTVLSHQFGICLSLCSSFVWWLRNEVFALALTSIQQQQIASALATTKSIIEIENVKHCLGLSGHILWLLSCHFPAEGLGPWTSNNILSSGRALARISSLLEFIISRSQDAIQGRDIKHCYFRAQLQLRLPLKLQTVFDSSQSRRVRCT